MGCITLPSSGRVKRGRPLASLGADRWEQMPQTRLKLRLAVLPGRLAVSRLEATAVVPDWCQAGQFTAVVRASGELSIVCEEARVPDGVRSERGWCALKVEGPLDFSMTGVLASLTVPLAESGVSIFAVSTFDTDYILVKGAQLRQAATALQSAGHHVADIPIGDNEAV